MAAGDAGGLVGRTLGDYTLNALVGVGGMAEVYRAHDSILGREVAVKVLSPLGAGDANYRELFRKEARRVAALDHPNIVPVYYLGEQDGLLFLVMPLMTESLRQRMERVGRLSSYESVRVIVQIAAALYVAHRHGIIHRDVKPENILLNAEGRPLLTDFGIARDASTTRDTAPNLGDPLLAPQRPSQTLARPGLPVGTPEYMAPEQLRMVGVDSRSDIYALGAVLYELLTGRAPHEAPTPEEVAALTLSAPVAPPSTYNPQVWPELELAVLTALAYEPSDRYPDAKSFATALLTAVEGHPEQRTARITPPSFATNGPPLGGAVVTPQSRQSPPPISTETEPTLRIAVPQQPRERRRLLFIALVVLVVAGVVLGSGYLFFGSSGDKTGSISATQTASSTSYYETPSATGTSGTVRPVTTGTPRSVVTIPGPPKSILKKPPPVGTPLPTATTVPATSTATSAPTATATTAATATNPPTGTPGATDTPAPTNTATTQPTATSTPVPPPPSLTFNPSSLTLVYQNNACWWGDVQTIGNPSGAPTRSWSWSVSSASSYTLEWSTDGVNWFNAVTNPPMDSNMAGGAADSIYVEADLTLVDGNGTPTGAGCDTSDMSSWSITVNDSLAGPYSYTAQIEQ